MPDVWQAMYPCGAAPNASSKQSTTYSGGISWHRGSRFDFRASTSLTACGVRHSAALAERMWCWHPMATCAGYKNTTRMVRGDGTNTSSSAGGPRERQKITPVNRHFARVAVDRSLTVSLDAIQKSPGTTRDPGDDDGTGHPNTVVSRDSSGAGDPTVLRRPASHNLAWPSVSVLVPSITVRQALEPAEL